MDSDSTTAGRPFLGVDRSATGRAWASRLADDRLALAIAVKNIVANGLGLLGVSAPEKM